MPRATWALVAAALLLSAAAPRGDSPVRVILWFDTEDYLLPASDDAALRVAEILSARGIRATFKVVGEKARVLERRGRSDVIAALGRHDIGYHTNLHSVHPTPAEYLAEAGWHDGLDEFVRREAPGAADVRRIFGLTRLSCYGQPGSSWAPQAVAALSRIGIAGPDGVPAYVDEGSHVGVADAPFWYAGALHVFNMGDNATRMDLHQEGGFERARVEFTAIYDRLRRGDGGLISIYYHPAEWVHEEFWDAVNFKRGANPPREAWQPPPQRPPASTEAAYKRFEQYVDFQRSLPGVTFVTASDLAALYRNRLREEGADIASIGAVARGVSGATALDVVSDAAGRLVSPAEAFALLTTAVAHAIRDGAFPARVAVIQPLGPAAPPPRTLVTELPWPAFRDAVLDAADAVRQDAQVPSRIFVGTRQVAPADFLRATATVAATLLAGGPRGRLEFPGRVAIPQGTGLATERHVADDNPGLYGGWIIHPEGFRAPGLVRLAKLQAWTLKAAERR